MYVVAGGAHGHGRATTQQSGTRPERSFWPTQPSYSDEVPEPSGQPASPGAPKGAELCLITSDPDHTTSSLPFGGAGQALEARPITRKGRNKMSLTLSLQTRPSTTGSPENREAGSANVTVQTSRETQHKGETTRTHSRGSRRDSCGGAPANPPSRPKRTKSPDVQPLPAAVVRTLPPQPISSSQREVPGGTVTQNFVEMEACSKYDFVSGCVH
ncbi:uncharacterized protein LOC120600059 isoform X2 [Pteropus medius]|uniref:uncharacterized protein LOC120600059 isoform X2 n=1 Tax=Pteropus vampyrus TaxID=132908 RepID=UPI00196A5BD3|nr:uncharacterized protein LOC120600059 isoform X2 [Pteropus giganteus]